jgi:hypothetical protein
MRRFVMLIVLLLTAPLAVMSQDQAPLKKSTPALAVKTFCLYHAL